MQRGNDDYGNRGNGGHMVDKNLNVHDDEIVRKIAWTLTEEETTEVREGLRILRAFKSFGMIGNWVKNILVWCAGIIVAWIAINEWLVKFIKGASGQP